MPASSAERSVVIGDEVIGGEERWTALGHTDDFRVLLVWTVRRDALRIVTARAAGSRARDTYLRAKGLLT